MTLINQVSEGVYFFMKRVRIPQIEVIQSADGQEFADRFNRTIKEAFLEADDRFEPKYTIEHTDGMFTSIITTSTVHEEMDSVEDEYRAQGISYRCKHCPYCDVPYDKRIKWCECSVEQRSTNKESPACERFYRHLKDGIIEAVER